MRWSTLGGWSWGAIASVTGCLGCANPLPVSSAGSSDSGGETTGASTSGASTTNTTTSNVSPTDATTSGGTIEDATTSDTNANTGPIAECGNGDVEDGEVCDGADWNGATCESLGFSEAGLACVGCQFDVSGCGPPTGMVEVPGGAFEMGSDASSDQLPIRQVTVDAFWMDEMEVTVDAYSACVDDGACTPPGAGGGCNWMVAGREDHPVNCVRWYDAEDYCGWAEAGTNRLPTEAEWEKAARGTDARVYPWGDSPAPSCTHVVMFEGGNGCGMGSTWAVGSKPLGDSPSGAHDMAGNVYEWVADWYATSYDAAEVDNPTGPAMGIYRVLRGGSWSDVNTSYLRAAFRGLNEPNGGNDLVGFRCARTPPAPL